MKERRKGGRVGELWKKERRVFFEERRLSGGGKEKGRE
jgi:hypothetical protein